MVYPTTGDAPCGVAPYTGNMKKITAIDELTVEFQLCNPDASFLPKVAFSAFGIQDSDYLTKHVPDGSILDASRTAPGRYVFKEWSKGNRIVWTANPDYWGDKAKTPTLELHWSDESAARLLDLQSGTVDGIDNPGTPDIATIQGDSTPEVLPARRAEHALPRLQQHAEAVRRRPGPPGDRHGHRPRPDRQELLPGRARPSPTYFTPCEIPFPDRRCPGDQTSKSLISLRRVRHQHQLLGGMEVNERPDRPRGPEEALNPPESEDPGDEVFANA